MNQTFNSIQHMKSNESENKYRVGEIVHALINPIQKLIIRRFVDDIYYCTIQADPTLKELVYFERELSNSSIS